MDSQATTPEKSTGVSPINTPPNSPEIITKDGIMITIIPIQLTYKNIPNSVNKNN